MPNVIAVTKYVTIDRANDAYNAELDISVKIVWKDFNKESSLT